jgi:hypothetical protein
MNPMATIHIEPAGNSKYRVSIDNRGKTTRFTVTATPEDVARYAPAGTTAERLIHASFEFLLERESPSSILSSFALPVIEQYFPEYPGVIRERIV